jgi:hypothetical protein
MPPFSPLPILRARPVTGRLSRDMLRPTAMQPRGWRAVSGRFLEAR